MVKRTYKDILEIFRAKNYDQKGIEETYGSLNEAVMKLTDDMPYSEIEKIEQFLYQDISGDVVYAFERVIERRRSKDARESMKRAARRAWISAMFSAISAIAAVVVAICMILSFKNY